MLYIILNLIIIFIQKILKNDQFNMHIMKQKTDLNITLTPYYDVIFIIILLLLFVFSLSNAKNPLLFYISKTLLELYAIVIVFTAKSSIYKSLYRVRFCFVKLFALMVCLQKITSGSILCHVML